MFRKPKVSVLMPVYNTKEAYLRTAIDSILNQSFKDFEFLILNDMKSLKRLFVPIKTIVSFIPKTQKIWASPVPETS